MSRDRIYAESLNQVRRDHLERYLFAGTMVKGRVLDAACGCGYGGYVLKKAGCTVTGIDIESTALDYAKNHWPDATYLQLDLNRELPREPFDAIVSFETLEHLDNAETVVKGFWKLAPLLVCSVPNQVKYPFSADAFKQDKYPHKRHYTPQEFSFLLERAGWTITERNSQQDKKSPVKRGTDGQFLVYVCTR